MIFEIIVGAIVAITTSYLYRARQLRREHVDVRKSKREVVKNIVHGCTHISNYFIPNEMSTYEGTLSLMCRDVIHEDNTIYELHDSIMSLHKMLSSVHRIMCDDHLHGEFMGEWNALFVDLCRYSDMTDTREDLIPSKITLKDLNDMVIDECRHNVNAEDSDIVNVCKLILASQSETVKKECVFKLVDIIKETNAHRECDIESMANVLTIYMESMAVNYIYG